MSRSATRPPAPMRLTPPRLSERQVELLEQLTALIFAEGFAHLTVGELAARLSCSRTTLYQIAPSKDELVLIAVDVFYQRVGQLALRALAELDDTIARLRAWMDITITEFSDISPAFLDDAARSVAVRRLIAQHVAYSISTIERVLAEGVEAGNIRRLDPYLAARLLQASVERAWDPQLLRESGRTGPEWIETAYSLFIDGLRPA